MYIRIILRTWIIMNKSNLVHSEGLFVSNLYFYFISQFSFSFLIRNNKLRNKILTLAQYKRVLINYVINFFKSFRHYGDCSFIDVKTKQPITCLILLQ